MKGMVYFFLSIVGVAFLGGVAFQDPGMIQIIWFGVEVRLSVVLSFFILLIFIWVIFLLRWFLTRLFGVPLRWICRAKRGE